MKSIISAMQMLVQTILGFHAWRSNLGIPEDFLPLIKRPLDRPVVEVVVVERVPELCGVGARGQGRE